MKQVPTSFDPINQRNLTSDPTPQTENSSTRIGTSYYKAQYQEYSDETFSEKIPRSSEQEYLGILGPIIRIFEGEVVRIVFRNNLTYPASFHLEGVTQKYSEGSNYQDGQFSEGDAVDPGANAIYEIDTTLNHWFGHYDQDSIFYPYHSQVFYSSPNSKTFQISILVW